MSSNFGKQIEISIFGESHGEAIGVVINGLPGGEEVDKSEIYVQLKRRAPGQDKTSTPRKESDTFTFLSGVLNGKTTGAPVCAIIKNQNTISRDYSNLEHCPRPSHSDYAAYVRYGGNNDIRGGGHFSGRLTAPLTIAGSICRQILARRGVVIGGHVSSIGGISDLPFDPVEVDAATLRDRSGEFFAVNEPQRREEMRALIEEARMSLDSVGGAVEIAAVGLPAGLGSPMFGGVENVLAGVIYGVPAVKAVSFGIGEEFAGLKGSEANDQMYTDGETVKTLTNNCGGICGGITNGMPLILRAALKPTPSISRPQKTVNLETMTDTVLEIHGRHDPCIVPRALPAVEAAVAVGLTNLMAEAGRL